MVSVWEILSLMYSYGISKERELYRQLKILGKHLEKIFRNNYNNNSKIISAIYWMLTICQTLLLGLCVHHFTQFLHSAVKYYFLFIGEKTRGHTTIR